MEKFGVRVSGCSLKSKLCVMCVHCEIYVYVRVLWDVCGLFGLKSHVIQALDIEKFSLALTDYLSSIQLSLQSFVFRLCLGSLAPGL